MNRSVLNGVDVLATAEIYDCYHDLTFGIFLVTSLHMFWIMWKILVIEVVLSVLSLMILNDIRVP